MLLVTTASAQCNGSCKRLQDKHMCPTPTWLGGCGTERMFTCEPKDTYIQSSWGPWVGNYKTLRHKFRCRGCGKYSDLECKSTRWWPVRGGGGLRTWLPGRRRLTDSKMTPFEKEWK